ncbi:response regulator [Botrimarina hoheduenensis]|uniref:Sensor histidine kinase RcsC n=1 Tax=Botrimarina hoheduenensis TaxID=2528000 RepID=A0A5C5VY24_9BACT|nr:response regulator [Botrimarina hoheduenensis]TWT42833.1 Sensor histidine kinase RcsC [Botrimarina hoheduenensis]
MVNHPHSVLVVDDEPEVRRLTVRALSAAGLACDQAGDGVTAMELIDQREYDAILTDLRMPQRHGYALCSDVLALHRPPQVMVLTALTDARLVRDLMGRGVYDVLQKPISYDVLAAKVVAMIDNTRTRSAAKAMPAPTKVSFLKQVELTLKELTELYGERLDTVFGDFDELPDPPPAIQQFIRRLAESEAAGEESAGFVPQHNERRKARATCFTTVVATPVDRLWRPICEPFKLAMRDISESGLRMLHTRATNSPFLALTWNATLLPRQQLRVVAKVMRCSACSPFYDIGGMFVMAD